MRRVAFVIAVAAWTLPVHADEALDRCLSAHERGQRGALTGKITQAIEDYRVCSNDVCPKLVRADCARRLERAEAEVPTLKIEVEGAERSDVRVAIDDGELAPLGADAIRVDPGKHRLRFETTDGRSSEREVEVELGDREIVVRAELARSVPVDSADPPEPGGAQASGPSPAVYVLGGVALIGIGSFIGFGLAGRGKQSELDDCKPDCTDSSLYDDMQRNYLIADVALGVGLASAAIATYLYLDGTSDGPRVGVLPSSSGALVTWGSGF